MTAVPSFGCRRVGVGTCTLGEGPVWDDAAGRLLWVDVTEGRVHEGELVGDADVGVRGLPLPRWRGSTARTTEEETP